MRNRVFERSPRSHHLVSMSICCMDPAVLERIPSGVPFGFDDLMFQILQEEHLCSSEHNGLWLV